MAASVESFINVDEDARSVFRRMMGMGRGTELSMKAIAFWMWLDSRGFQDIITRLSAHDDEFLGFVCNEAEAILSSLMKHPNTLISPNIMRLTLTLAQRFVSPSVIMADKEIVLKGIAHIYTQVCCVIFKDILQERSEEEEEIVSAGEGSSQGKKVALWQTEGMETEQSSAPLSATSKLNPYAKEWNPVTERAPEEDRCLFLTFSNGFPLTENQIINFFNEKYEGCVERVYVHWPDPKNRNKAPPLFGKVIFKASYVPVMILCGQNEAKFWVDRKPLWCKRFDPTKKSGRRRSI